MGQVQAPGGVVLIYRNDPVVHHFVSSNDLMAHVLERCPLDVMISEVNAILTTRGDVARLGTPVLEAFREMCDREIDRRNLQKLKGKP